MDVRYLAAARKGLKTMPRGDREALMTKLRHYANTGEGDVRNAYR